MNLSPEELNRYSRHILLPEIGMEGQEKLKKAKALVVGAGGLGCPALLYLTAAGVGTIGIIDPDVVDSSNLQRQVLYKKNDIGQPKVICAKKHLSGLNPLIDFKIYQQKLVAANALEIIRNYDLIIDGSDNFATRYLVNDACVLEGKPFIYGALHRFSGQISVFNYRGGPTYRCLFPEPPAAGEIPSCSEAGVVGVLPGIIGTFQASEAIKIICGLGEVASGKLLMFDALTLSFDKVKIKKDLNAPAIKALIDYDEYCGTKLSEIPLRVNNLSVQEFKEWQETGKKYQLVDVREKAEYELENLNGQLIPLSQLKGRIGEINRSDTIVLHCQSGARSRQAALLLKDQGFRNVFSLAGGMNAWKKG